MTERLEEIHSTINQAVYGLSRTLLAPSASTIHVQAGRLRCSWMRFAALAAVCSWGISRHSIVASKEPANSSR